MEHDTRFELATPAWKAGMLPLHQSCKLWRDGVEPSVYSAHYSQDFMSSICRFSIFTSGMLFYSHHTTKLSLSILLWCLHERDNCSTLEPQLGLEPRTDWLLISSSTNWSIEAYDCQGRCLDHPWSLAPWLLLLSHSSFIYILVETIKYKGVYLRLSRRRCLGTILVCAIIPPQWNLWPEVNEYRSQRVSILIRYYMY